MKLKYIQISRVKGHTYIYYRRDGRQIRINEAPGTAAFLKRYAEIHESFHLPEAEEMGPFDRLVVEYLGSDRFKLIPAQKTRRDYRLHLERMREKFGHLSPAGLTTKAIMVYHESLSATPASANNMLKAVKSLMKYAIRRGIIDHQPITRDIEKFKTGSLEPWTEQALENFKPSGSVKTAFMLALYTGQRLGDVLAMRWDKIKNGWIEVKQIKTGVDLVVPIHPKLGEYLDTLPRDTLYIVSNRNGAPYTVSGFQSVWQKTNAPFTFHGLRKSAASRLAEAGATTHQIAAITGHKSLSMIEYYSKSAKQKKSAEVVKGIWEREQD